MPAEEDQGGGRRGGERNERWGITLEEGRRKIER